LLDRASNADLRLRAAKHVVVYLVPDPRIAADNVGQRGASYLREQLRVGKEARIMLEPEAIAVSKTAKLVGNDGPEGLADHCVRLMVFCQSGGPQVRIVDIAIDQLKCLPDIRI
jgi:hypothetical protein